MKTFHLKEMRRSVKTLADETREMRAMYHGGEKQEDGIHTVNTKGKRDRERESERKKCQAKERQQALLLKNANKL